MTTRFSTSQEKKMAYQMCCHDCQEQTKEKRIIKASPYYLQRNSKHKLQVLKAKEKSKCPHWKR
jgi:hypothetical protein